MPDGKSTCKVNNCSSKIRTKGFCFQCYVKFTRGNLDFNGEKTTKLIQKEQRAKKKTAKKKSLRKNKEWEQAKNDISQGFKKNPNLLHIIQQEYPESKKSTWCKALEFWICPVSCYSRLFVREYIDEACKKCHVYDNDFEKLKKIIKEHESE